MSTTVPAINTASRLPNFVGVGVEKCGTTSFYDVLQQHPLIGLSRNKETFFFNQHWQQGLGWYQQQFAQVSTDAICLGEFTPSYHRFPEVIPRIQQSLGADCKIVIMLREPRQRAFSHYLHDFAREPKITDLLFKRYLSTCLYSLIVEAYQQAFGKDHCLTLIFEEDFLPNQQIAVDKLCAFLNIDSYTVEPVHSNSSYLPRVLQSPDYDCHISIEDQILSVPANSLLYYTHRFNSTRLLNTLSSDQQQWYQQQITQAIHHVNAEKLAFVYEQNVKADLDTLESLIDRSLDCWRQPLADLKAKPAPIPAFLKSTNHSTNTVS